MASVIMSCNPLVDEHGFRNPASWLRTWYLGWVPAALGFAAAAPSLLVSVFLAGMVIDV
jgi:hypothetical protein